MAPPAAPSVEQATPAAAPTGVTLELFWDLPDTTGAQPISTITINTSATDLSALDLRGTPSLARYARLTYGGQTYVYRAQVSGTMNMIFLVTDQGTRSLNDVLTYAGASVDTSDVVTIGGTLDFAAAAIATTPPGTAATDATAGAATGTDTTAAATGTDAGTTGTTGTDTGTTGTTGTDTTGTTGTTGTDTTGTTGTTGTDTGTTGTTGTDTGTTGTTGTDTGTTGTTGTDTGTTGTTGTDTTGTTGTTGTDTTGTTGTTGTDTTGTTGTTGTDTTGTTGTSTAGTTGTTGTAATSAAAAAATGAQPLVETTTTAIGGLQVSVVPASGTLPAASATTFALQPISGATNATSSLESNIVTLNYESTATLQAVAAFYDQQMVAQGFTRTENAAQARTSDTEIVVVYTRGQGTVILTLSRVTGGYRVTADLTGLATQ